MCNHFILGRAVTGVTLGISLTDRKFRNHPVTPLHSQEILIHPLPTHSKIHFESAESGWMDFLGEGGSGWLSNDSIERIVQP